MGLPLIVFPWLSVCDVVTQNKWLIHFAFFETLLPSIDIVSVIAGDLHEQNWKDVAVVASGGLTIKQSKHVL